MPWCRFIRWGSRLPANCYAVVSIRPTGVTTSGGLLCRGVARGVIGTTPSCAHAGGGVPRVPSAPSQRQGGEGDRGRRQRRRPPIPPKSWRDIYMSPSGIKSDFANWKMAGTRNSDSPTLWACVGQSRSRLQTAFSAGLRRLSRVAGSFLAQRAVGTAASTRMSCEGIYQRTGLPGCSTGARSQKASWCATSATTRPA